MRLLGIAPPVIHTVGHRSCGRFRRGEPPEPESRSLKDDGVVHGLAEVDLRGFAGRTVSKLGAHPLFTLFVLCAVVPDQLGRLALANAATNVELAPLLLVLRNLQLDDA